MATTPHTTTDLARDRRVHGGARRGGHGRTVPVPRAVQPCEELILRGAGGVQPGQIRCGGVVGVHAPRYTRRSGGGAGRADPLPGRAEGRPGPTSSSFVGFLQPRASAAARRLAD